MDRLLITCCFSVPLCHTGYDWTSQRSIWYYLLDDNMAHPLTLNESSNKNKWYFLLCMYLFIHFRLSFINCSIWLSVTPMNQVCSTDKTVDDSKRVSSTSGAQSKVKKSLWTDHTLCARDTADPYKREPADGDTLQQMGAGTLGVLPCFIITTVAEQVKKSWIISEGLKSRLTLFITDDWTVSTAAHRDLLTLSDNRVVYLSCFALTCYKPGGLIVGLWH